MNWKIGKKDFSTIEKIVDRMIDLDPTLRHVKANMTMDIHATHCNGCELDLKRLLDAGEFDLRHDVFGIMNNLDRRTGKLQNCFLPRYTSIK